MEQTTGQEVARGYLNIRQAEQYTGLSRWTLARARARGDLPAIRIGAAIRLSVEDLDGYMRARRA